MLYPCQMITCDETTKQAIHPNVAIQCFTCFMTLLLFYTCHITTMLPCFKVWEIHVTFTCCTTTIHKQSSMKQTEFVNVAYVRSVTMAWWHRWCICLWNDMQFRGSQTPRVLHLCRTGLCVSHPSKVGPFSGEPCPPFYRLREEQGLQMGERG